MIIAGLLIAAGVLLMAVHPIFAWVLIVAAILHLVGIL